MPMCEWGSGFNGCTSSALLPSPLLEKVCFHRGSNELVKQETEGVLSG